MRVVGGWSEFQFAEKRLPTLDELNAAAPDTPVFVLHLYCQAMLNRAALRAVGYDKSTPNPPGGEIQRDTQGNPTGLLIARPNATILYATLAKGPKLPVEYQYNSTRQFMRELNRLGLTSVIDAGGGFQNYPDDYVVIDELHKRGELTLRIAYNLFTQKPQKEKEDFARWIAMAKPGQGDDVLRLNGAGEMLVFSAADFEDFLEPRPDLTARLETDLEDVISLLAANRWPFRLHATYNESITRFLNVFEKVNSAYPLDGLHWFLDHAETISDRNIERVRALGGGIAVQHRMAFQGEYFVARYGQAALAQTPPIAKMLKAGLPVGAGTDATRVANYNPWDSIYWLVSGRTVGGFELYPEANSPEPVWRRSVSIRWAAHGSRARAARRARSSRASSPTLPCCRRTILRCRRSASSAYRVGADRPRRRGGACDRRVRQPCAAAAAGDAGLVTGEILRRLWCAALLRARCQLFRASGRMRGVSGPPGRMPRLGCEVSAHEFNASSVLARLLGQGTAPVDRTWGATPNGFFGVGCDCFAF